MEFDNLYLTFQEYQELGGNLEEMPFNILSFKAQKVIDKYTFGRLKDLTNQKQEVKLCMFEIINELNNYENITKNTGIKSENIDGYGITYENVSSENIKSLNESIKNCIKDYLAECKLEDGTPYLYCGVE